MMKRAAKSLTRLANAAFQKVAEEVIEEAKRTGTPVILWEDGQVQEVPPEELEARIKRKSRKKPKPARPTKK